MQKSYYLYIGEKGWQMHRREQWKQGKQCNAAGATLCCLCPRGHCKFINHTSTVCFAGLPSL